MVDGVRAAVRGSSEAGVIWTGNGVRAAVRGSWEAGVIWTGNGVRAAVRGSSEAGVIWTGNGVRAAGPRMRNWAALGRREFKTDGRYGSAAHSSSGMGRSRAEKIQIRP